jgi:hypothetical protein
MIFKMWLTLLYVCVMSSYSVFYLSTLVVDYLQRIPYTTNLAKKYTDILNLKSQTSFRLGLK